MIEEGEDRSDILRQNDRILMEVMPEKAGRRWKPLVLIRQGNQWEKGEVRRVRKPGFLQRLFHRA